MLSRIGSDLPTPDAKAGSEGALTGLCSSPVYFLKALNETWDLWPCKHPSLHYLAPLDSPSRMGLVSEWTANPADKRKGAALFSDFPNTQIRLDRVDTWKLIQMLPKLGLLGWLSFAASAAAQLAVLLTTLESSWEGRYAITVSRWTSNREGKLLECESNKKIWGER